MTWLLTPSASWNGTATYLPRTVPTQSNTVYGSGFAERAVAAFDEADGIWVEELGHTITVGAGIGNRDMIESVTFWLEGNTQTVTVMTVNPRTGSIGFCATVASRPGQNGDAQLYATVKPVNGMERVLGPLNLTLNTDRSPGVLIVRPVRYVNFDSGSDSNDGLTECTAWATLTNAMSASLSGAIIHLAGATAGDVPQGGAANTRMIEFRGKGIGVTTLRPTVISLNSFRFSLTKVMFSNLTVETDLAGQLYGNPSLAGRIVFSGCRIGHSAGAVGPLDKGYPVGTLGNEKSNLFFRNQEGQKWYVINSVVEDTVGAGIQLWRNSSFRGPMDVVQIGSYASGGGSNFAIFGLDALQFGNKELRLHAATDLTVASVSRSGSNSTINFSGSPNITNGNSAPHLRVLQSAGSVDAGDVTFPKNEDGSEDFPTLGYRIVARTASSITVSDVANKLGALQAGDLCRAYEIAHADMFQTVRQADHSPTIENLYVQNYRSRGHSSQPVLLQSDYQRTTTFSSLAGNGTETVFSSPTVTTSGDVATFTGNHGIQPFGFLRLKSGAQAGEARLVIETISATQVRLESAFSSDQTTGASWSVRRGIKDIFICNSLLFISESRNEVGHLEPGLVHVTFANVTIPGLAPSGASLAFTQLASNGSNMYRNVRFFDCVLRRLEPSGGSMPTACFGDNNWYMTGTNRDTGGAADGNFWTAQTDAFLDGYRPPVAMTRTHMGKLIMLPYDMHRDLRLSSAKVGALN